MAGCAIYFAKMGFVRIDVSRGLLGHFGQGAMALDAVHVHRLLIVINKVPACSVAGLAIDLLLSMHAGEKAVRCSSLRRHLCGFLRRLLLGRRCAGPREERQDKNCQNDSDAFNRFQSYFLLYMAAAACSVVQCNINFGTHDDI